MASKPRGLTSQQAATLLAEVGPNELPQQIKKSLLKKIVKLFKEPMIAILIVVSVLYLIMGDLTEGIFLTSSIFVIIGITFYQEKKADDAVQALRDLSSPRALVVREGIEKRIAAKEVVPGDAVLLHEGDRVPADGVLLHSTNLHIDESLLSGESFPAKKKSEDKVFSSTLVTSGYGAYCVTHTGAKTEAGKIGKSLSEERQEELNLKTEINQMVKVFAWLGAIVCIAIILLDGFLRGDWLNALLIGLSTEMSLLPEEFPVILTIFMAMGAWRLSKVQMLVRQPIAIERLGAVTVLCVDKTGTLTENKMTVVDASDSAIEFGVLASRADPFDPMEKAIKKIANDKSLNHSEWKLIKEYSLSENLFAMSCVWKKEAGEVIVATKGAPEAIFQLCQLSEQEKEKINVEISKKAQMGLRMLGVAKGFYNHELLPESQNDFKLQWVGLIAFEDPLRANVTSAVKKCYNAGIRIIMMTGDNPLTAINIANKAGIKTESVLTGDEVKKLSDNELLEKLSITSVFARVVPEQKLRIVRLLQKLNNVVAMTGDGVNDAPSLKWSNVGISMGQRGTDVAREASDIVLTDDNFSSIVDGIQRGRSIFLNIKKAMSFVISVHVPIAGLSLMPLFFGWPLILWPVHIVFLELIIDPACTLLFESHDVDPKVMDQPPRELKSRLLSLKEIFRSSMQGLLILFSTVFIYWFSFSQLEKSVEWARTVTFLFLICGNIALIVANLTGGSIKDLTRTFQKSSIKMVIGLILLGIVLIIQIPKSQKLFAFTALQAAEIGSILLLSSLIFGLIFGWNRWVLLRQANQKLLNDL